MSLSAQPVPASPAAEPALERRLFWWLMLAALLVLGAGIGLRDPWPSDEPRFTLVAKHMIESGDWLFPHRGTRVVFRQAADADVAGGARPTS